jgi:hypothetical protein
VAALETPPAVYQVVPVAERRTLEDLGVARRLDRATQEVPASGPEVVPVAAALLALVRHVGRLRRLPVAAADLEQPSPSVGRR